MPEGLGTITAGGRDHRIARLDAFDGVERLPYSLRILLESLARAAAQGHDDETQAVARWQAGAEPSETISFRPARVLMQDFTGVPAVVDLAAMRDAMRDLGGDPAKINPQLPTELVIDHSIQVDEFANRLAIVRNGELEFERNRERYAFLRWGRQAFDDFSVVPPNTGIVHQVNLEYLARVVEAREQRRRAVGVPRHRRRHRLAHHDGERARRARLGRRRDRGRGRDARRGDLDARPAGRRLPPRGRAPRGRDGDRPRPRRSRRSCARPASSGSSSSTSARASAR